MHLSPLARTSRPLLFTLGALFTACGGDDAPVAVTPARPDMQKIASPVPDECIPDVRAGDHTYQCGGLDFAVMVDPMCTQYACGLIFDVHGGTMSGPQMRDNTLLHEIAPPKGYITVHPSAPQSQLGGLWTSEHYPVVADFMERTIRAFHVDEQRVHFTGFSQGGQMTWWFLCNQNDRLASAAPVAGALEENPCFDSAWSPRVPTLVMNGLTDAASTIDAARAQIAAVTTALELGPPSVSSDDGHVVRTRYEGAGGMVLDYIEHDYGGQAVLGGHCIPGGIDVDGAPHNYGLNATTCTTGELTLNWGETVLTWFVEHPRSAR